MMDNLWFSGSAKPLPDGFEETIQYPAPMPEGMMYQYYYDGKRWIDVRFLDIQSVGGIRLEGRV